jgi:hypothetical protein
LSRPIKPATAATVLNGAAFRPDTPIEMAVTMPPREVSPFEMEAEIADQLGAD